MCEYIVFAIDLKKPLFLKFCYSKDDIYILTHDLEISLTL